MSLNPCAIPVAAEDFDGDNRWLSIHKRFIQECKEKDPDVIFIGDSILESLQFTEIWNQFFAPMHCLNFSIKADKTENILWRVKNQGLENVKPKVIVLHVGTNNTQNTPDEIVDGIIEIIQAIRLKFPEVYIVFPTLLPRGHSPNKLRSKNENINDLLKQKCCGMNKVQIVTVDKGLVQLDGTISHHEMFDYLNLTNAGCKKVFEPICDLLHQILNENEHEKDLTPSE